MIHGLNNDFLYAAFKINCKFTDSYGSEKDNPYLAANGSATVFFVQVNGKICLVTNRHVVDVYYAKDWDKEYKDWKLKSLELEGWFSKNNLLKHSILNHSKIVYSDNNDIACLIEPRFLSPTSVNLDYFIKEEMIAIANDFSENICVCDFVAFTGYSHFSPKDRRPIFRSGIISSDPRQDFKYKNITGSCLAYEAFSTPGASGSPVFAFQKGIKVGGGLNGGGYVPPKLIGINSGHLVDPERSNHSGMSYFYKSSAILELLQKAISNFSS